MNAITPTLWVFSGLHSSSQIEETNVGRPCLEDNIETVCKSLTFPSAGLKMPGWETPRQCKAWTAGGSRDVLYWSQRTFFFFFENLLSPKELLQITDLQLQFSFQKKAVILLSQQRQREHLIRREASFIFVLTRETG